MGSKKKKLILAVTKHKDGADSSSGVRGKSIEDKNFRKTVDGQNWG